MVLLWALYPTNWWWDSLFSSTSPAQSFPKPRVASHWGLGTHVWCRVLWDADFLGKKGSLPLFCHSLPISKWSRAAVIHCHLLWNGDSPLGCRCSSIMAQGIPTDQRLRSVSETLQTWFQTSSRCQCPGLKQLKHCSWPTDHLPRVSDPRVGSSKTRHKWWRSDHPHS